MLKFDFQIIQLLTTIINSPIFDFISNDGTIFKQIYPNTLSKIKRESHFLYR